MVAADAELLTFTRCNNEIDRIVNIVLERAAAGSNIALGFDLDKTLMYSKKQAGLKQVAPDAYIAPWLKKVFQSLNSMVDPVSHKRNTLCFTVTGRSTDFAAENLGLFGSGQFHSEATDVFEGDHKIIKSRWNVDAIRPLITWAVQGIDGYIENDEGVLLDKSHHICVMTNNDNMGEYIHKMQAIAHAYNTILGDSKEAIEKHIYLEYGEDYAEFGPKPTCKGRVIQEITQQYREFFENCFLVYFGDTPEKDGPAIDTVQNMGGMGIAVGAKKFDDYCSGHICVPSPKEVYTIIQKVHDGLAHLNADRGLVNFNT
ncbi:hypothetical protein [Vibrio vulnificus]|uniref:hypothetical protein n=1 Tax=Vibrio vulnificus TaxID=672 RepID=UPI00165E1383|nr:hypothetical protein [Vibrio vulnificus]